MKSIIVSLSRALLAHLYPSRSALRVGISAVAFFCLLFVASNAPASRADWRGKVSRELQAIYASATAAGAGSGKPTSTYSIRYDSHGRLQIDVWFDCTVSTPSGHLMAAGMVIGTTVRATPMCVVEGWANVSAIPELASLAGIVKIELPHYREPKKPTPLQKKPQSPMTSAVGANTIDGAGITIMAADQYITNTGVSGAGVTLGVISGDVESITGNSRARRAAHVSCSRVQTQRRTPPSAMREP